MFLLSKIEERNSVATNFLPKQVLFDQLSQIHGNRETGFLTILTDSKRSVLLRFHGGRLTHCNCRSKEISEAIQVLMECELVKFTYVPGAVENRPEIMPTENFLQLINPGGTNSGSFSANEPPAISNAPMAAPFSQAPTTPKVQQAPMIDMALYQALSSIAEEYLGLVGDMVVSDALNKNQSVPDTIEEVANSIPDVGQANAFRAAALDLIPNF
ncbi:MAG: hypothetical protein ACI8P9_002890 [Parasphingorhabdus sp.]